MYQFLASGTISSGQLLLPDGTLAAPSLAFTSDNDGTGTGIYRSSANQITFSANGADIGTILATQLRMSSGALVGWASGSSGSTGLDTTIVRAAAGIVRTADGAGTGLGYLKTGINVVANTGTVTPAVTDSGNLYTNTGDADGSQVTLPNDPTIGTYFDFAVRVAQALTIVPSAGESIQDAATNGTTSTVSSTVGSTMRLVAITGGSGAVWQVMAKTGVWVTT